MASVAGAFAEHIVDAGDAALLLPIGAVVFGVCRLSGAKRTALAWALSIGFCGFSILLLKIAVYYVADPVLISRLSSPSGHAALSTVVYGSLALVFGAPCENRWLRLCFVLAVGLLVAAIGVASVVTGAHTPGDIAAGLAVGGTSVVVFRIFSRRGIRESVPTALLGVLVAVVFILLYGRQFEAEAMIRRVGVTLHRALAASRHETSQLDICPGGGRRQLFFTIRCPHSSPRGVDDAAAFPNVGHVLEPPFEIHRVGDLVAIIADLRDRSES